ncbi:MAG: tRNA preQ1(34) S-adenosylmethionine ribosyltransferase-isomerase QueA [Opitutaceae bacterium]
MPPLSTDLFDFALPPHLIAQRPAERRDASRLLVVDRAAHRFEHRVFSDLPDYLHAGDTLFRNTAAVLPARLQARRASGGQVECLLLRPTPQLNAWWCLLRPGKKLPVGAHFSREDAFDARVIERDSEGAAKVEFSTVGNVSIVEIANRLGQVPLPPYILREEGGNDRQSDLDRYQTVYADPARQVAVAAPTAGLHFTSDLLSQIQSKGVTTANLTLHVGLGTFKPIATAQIEQHPIHRECFELPQECQRALFNPGRGRRIAVGTTSVRAIEAFLSHHHAPVENGRDYVDEASLYLFPPCHFRGVDALVTNFHQPRSTLLCLVAAFLSPGSTDGINWLHELYAEAIRKEYRFFSYGDAMLIH